MRADVFSTRDKISSQIFEDIHRNHAWLYDEASITAIADKYMVSDTQEKMLTTSDQLISMLRAARKTAGK